MRSKQTLVGMQRGTVANAYHRMRTEAFRRMQIADANERDEEAAEESDESEEDLSEDFGSSDDDIELFDYENQVTSDYWLPNEARLFCIYNGRRFVNYNDEQDLVNRQAENISDSEASGSEEEDKEDVFTITNTRTHSEYMTMKQSYGFTQDTLRSNGIYMLDHDSDIFIWIGSKVSSDIGIDSMQKVGQAVHSVHGKGR